MKVYKYERIKKLQRMYSDYLTYLDTTTTCQDSWQNALNAADELALQLEKTLGYQHKGGGDE